MRRNYIIRCEPRPTMAVHAKARMTSFLFLAWIAYFVKALEIHSGISPINCDLLNLNGYNSHVILDVLYKAKQHGLDLLTNCNF